MRPVEWERPEWRKWFWMKTMTFGLPWDTNTLLRCQRECLLLPARSSTSKQRSNWSSQRTLSVSGLRRLFMSSSPSSFFFCHSEQGCNPLSERILCQQEDEHRRKGRGHAVFLLFCIQTHKGRRKIWQWELHFHLLSVTEHYSVLFW